MALMGYNYNADRIKPSTYIQTNSYNNVDVKNIDFGALFGALKKNRSRITSVAVFCGGSRIRTGDPMLAKHVLYQLSYTPGKKKAALVGGSSGRPWQS